MVWASAAGRRLADNRLRRLRNFIFNAGRNDFSPCRFATMVDVDCYKHAIAEERMNRVEERR